MATTQATAERRAAALARLHAAAITIATATGQALTPPATVKDLEIDRIALIEYAATVIEAAAAMLTPAPTQNVLSSAASEPAAETRRRPAK